MIIVHSAVRNWSNKSLLSIQVQWSHMSERGDLEDNLIPRYRFEWDDGTERTTDDLPEQHPVSNEVLAELGKEDEECEVTLIGYET